MSKKPKHRKKRERRWWVVAAIYTNVHPNKKSRYLTKRLSERRVFLIHAKDETTAEAMGAEMAREHEHQFRATGGEFVAYKLRKVETVIHLFDTKPRHGTEVYWDWIVDKKRDSRPLIV